MTEQQSKALIAAELAANEVERMLTFLHGCEDDSHRYGVPLRLMDGAVPFSATFASRELEAFQFMRNDGNPAVWPVDMKTVALAVDTVSGAEFPEGTLAFDRIRTCSRAEARKLGFSRFSPKMVMREEIFALPKGETESFRAPLSFLGGDWVLAGPCTGNNTEFVQRMLGMALALRYEWTVWIGCEGGPRIRFLSDPLGAREAFRLRDLPPGRERRAALRHWVTAHWRTKRADAESLAWVRQHLRGTTDFKWNGLRCRIQPPEHDIEALAQQDEARNAIRSMEPSHAK